MATPTPPPTPTPSVDPTLTPMPAPSPTTVVVQLVQDSDPSGLIVAIIAALIAAVGAVTGIVALVQNYQARTKPRMEISRKWAPNRDPFRYGSDDPEDPTKKVWWTDTTWVAVIRNWGNGIAYDVRLHHQDGVESKEFSLGNLDTGESIEQEYHRTVGPDRKPNTWVTWNEYPGPKERSEPLNGSQWEV